MMKNLFICASMLVLAMCTGCQSGENTPDLALADVHGPVKCVQKKSYVCDRKGNIENDTLTWNNRYFEFDRNGQMTIGFIDTPDSDPGTIRLYRDDEGRVEIIQAYDPVWDAWYDTEVNYNDDNLLSGCTLHSRDGVSLISFTYDDDAEFRTVGKEMTITGDPFMSVTHYKVLETDDRGNWIRILARINYNISGEKTREYRLDVREIEYY